MIDGRPSPITNKPPNPAELDEFGPQCPKCAAIQKVESRENKGLYCLLCREHYTYEDRLRIHGFTPSEQEP